MTTSIARFIVLTALAAMCFGAAAALAPASRLAAAPARSARPEGTWTTAQSAPVVAVIETTMGTIEIEVDVARAPITGANFLRYVDAGLYNGGRFHRSVRPDTETRTDYPIQVIQGQMNQSRRAEGFPPIKMESTQATGIKHTDGVLSMARGGADSATNEFFIVIGSQPELDFGGKRNADGQGFATFGRVTGGMDVVRKIQAAPVKTGSQTLDPPVTITRIVRK
jgi:peptidyl-prolyl cis-trans isomerase A (cyclophilin A)